MLPRSHDPTQDSPQSPAREEARPAELGDASTSTVKADALAAARASAQAARLDFEAMHGRPRAREPELRGDSLAAQVRRRQDAAARSEPILCADGEFRRDPDLDRPARQDAQRRRTDGQSTFSGGALTRCVGALTAA